MGVGKGANSVGVGVGVSVGVGVGKGANSVGVGVGVSVGVNVGEGSEGGLLVVHPTSNIRHINPTISKAFLLNLLAGISVTFQSTLYLFSHQGF